MMEWQPIETASKNEHMPILVWYDHDADPYYDPSNPDRLTDYAVHTESSEYLSGKGVAVAIWRDSWEETDGWESSNSPYTMPAAWWLWVDKDAGDHVVNATHWMPLPEPPKPAA